MTVISVEKDAESLTMTIIAQFDAPTTRVWQVWQDPRQLERWWGPPTYPATVVGHDLTPGGSVTYFMTGPEGETHHGWWRVSAVEAPLMPLTEIPQCCSSKFPTLVALVRLADDAGFEGVDEVG